MLFTILLQLFDRMACELIVELEQVRYAIPLDIDQRQKEKGEVFFWVVQLGISKYVLDCLEDSPLPQAHRDYLGEYTFFKMPFFFGERCKLQRSELLNELPDDLMRILIVLFLH